jgi:tetratricopeptide (TPR) repeat protein
MSLPIEMSIMFLGRFSFAALLALLLSFSALAQPPAALPPAQLDDWGAFNALEKQLKEGKATPQQIIESYQKLYDSRPKMLSSVAIKLTVEVSNAYKKLGQADKALEIDAWAIEKYPDDPSIVWLIEHKASTLHALKKHDETLKLIEDNWFPLVRGAQSGEQWLVMYAATALRHAAEGQQAVGQSEKVASLILKALNHIPALWEDSEQGMGNWKNGWMYEALIPHLIKAKRGDEALSWAKWHYVMAPFDKDALGRATTSLGRAWAEKEDYAKIRAFSQAQEAEAQPPGKNPLAEIKLPVLEEKLFKEHLARTQINLDVVTGPLNRPKSKEAISLLLAREDYSAAMNLARRLLKDDPTKADGALQVCRVFKAADGNIRRANQFLEYLDGKAENPIPDFLKEQETKGK